MSGGTTLTLTGFLILMHAAYSCLHFKTLLQELDISIDDAGAVPPPDVVVECAVALLLVFVGQLLGPGAGAWQPCLTTTGSTGAKRRPLAAPAYITRDFDIYADRSRVIAAYQKSL